jgi:hypothetical protein
MVPAYGGSGVEERARKLLTDSETIVLAGPGTRIRLKRFLDSQKQFKARFLYCILVHSLPTDLAVETLDTDSYCVLVVATDHKSENV